MVVVATDVVWWEKWLWLENVNILDFCKQKDSDYIPAS